MENISIGEDYIEMEGEFYIVFLQSPKAAKIKGKPLRLKIEQEYVEQEAERRGKLNGSIGYYSDKMVDETISFYEWSTDILYKEEFDAFVEELTEEIFRRKRLR